MSILFKFMSKSFRTPQQVIYVCTGSKCKKRGGKEISRLLRDCVKSAGRKDSVEIIKTDCTDRCKFAPVMSFQPQNIWLKEVTEQQALQFLDQYVLNRQAIPQSSSVPITNTLGAEATSDQSVPEPGDRPASNSDPE
jgi:(2Fe-2S) ferredoxin